MEMYVFISLLYLFKQKFVFIWKKKQFIQVGYQLLSVVVASSWAFIVTFLILQFIGLIPFIRLKLTEREELMWVAIILF